MSGICGGCAGPGVWRAWREQWQLLLVAGVAWLVALGPTLQVRGTDTGLPLPYAWLIDLPLMSTARRPALFVVVCIVVATVFAGIGLHWLVSRRTPRQRATILALVSLLAAVELLPPRERAILAFDAPPFYETIRQKPGAVADLPFDWQEDGRSLINQMTHQQPIIGGYVARWPRYPSVQYVPLLNQLVYMRRWDDIVPLAPDDLAAMQCTYPIRHVILRKDLTTRAQQRELRDLLASLSGAPLVPTFEDSRHIWYELLQFADRCRPFLYPVEGWNELENNRERRWRWLGAAGYVWFVNPSDQPVAATLRFRLEAFAQTRSVELWRGEQRLAQWETRSGKHRDYRLHVRLAPGATRLQLRVTPAFDTQTQRQLSVAALELAFSSNVTR